MTHTSYTKVLIKPRLHIPYRTSSPPLYLPLFLPSGPPSDLSLENLDLTDCWEQGTKWGWQCPMFVRMHAMWQMVVVESNKWYQGVERKRGVKQVCSEVLGQHTFASIPHSFYISSYSTSRSFSTSAVLLIMFCKTVNTKWMINTDLLVVTHQNRWHLERFGYPDDCHWKVPLGSCTQRWMFLDAW